MNRDPRQQAYLKAMGIDVWVQRNVISTVAEAPVIEETVPSTPRVVAEEVEDFPLSQNDVSAVNSLDWPALKQHDETSTRTSKLKLAVLAPDQFRSEIFLPMYLARFVLFSAAVKTLYVWEHRKEESVR